MCAKGSVNGVVLILPGDFPEAGATGPVDLPPPDMGSLPDIARALREVSPFQRDRVAEQLLRNNYLRKLLDLFRVSCSQNGCEAVGFPAPVRTTGAAGLGVLSLVRRCTVVPMQKLLECPRPSRWKQQRCNATQSHTHSSVTTLSLVQSQ